MAVSKSIADILIEISKVKEPEQKVLGLRHYDSFALRTILQGFFDSNVKFLLPKGPMPEGFKFSEFDEPLRLYSDARKLYLFVEGGVPALAQPRRESLFLDFIGGLSKKDADLIIAMKDKAWPYSKGLTVKHINEAFPGLIPNE